MIMMPFLKNDIRNDQKALCFPVLRTLDPAKAENIIKPVEMSCLGRPLSALRPAWAGRPAGWAHN